MSSPVITCTGICKSFTRHVIPAESLQERILHALRRPKVTITALRDVSLAVHSGEWVSITGPNGSGKTTLLRILAGLMVSDAGTRMVHGSVSSFLGLGTGFHDERSAEENIRIFCLLQGMPSRDIRRTTARIMEFAGVPDTHRLLPLKCYSTGQRMRLAFAAATCIDADIFLFDEILAVGDAGFREKCTEYLQSLKACGKTAILVSPVRGGLFPLCDRVILMQQGAIVQDVPAAESAPAPMRVPAGAGVIAA